MLLECNTLEERSLSSTVTAYHLCDIVT